MAEGIKKRERPKHSSFEYPTIGELLPDGTKLKKNRDGTITPIYPKKNTEKGKTARK